LIYIDIKYLLGLNNVSMKVVSSIGTMKKRHPDCQVVKRRGRIYVICKSEPKFKVRQGYKKKRNKL